MIDMNEINKYTEEVKTKTNEIIIQLLIDDIFEIAQGVFTSYKEYVGYKQNVIEGVRTANNAGVVAQQDRCSFTYYVEPIILRESAFNYIIKRYLRR